MVLLKVAAENHPAVNASSVAFVDSAAADDGQLEQRVDGGGGDGGLHRAVIFPVPVALAAPRIGRRNKGMVRNSARARSITTNRSVRRSPSTDSGACIEYFAREHAVRW